MRLRRFSFFSAVSLGFSALAVLFWLGSYVSPGIVTASSPHHGVTGTSGEPVPARTTLFLISDRGYLGWCCEVDVIGDHASAWTVGTLPIESTHEPFWTETGSLFLRLATDGPEGTVPYWLLVLATGVTPAAWFLRRYRARRRRLRHRVICGLCGYDLRATPEQCPECGSARESGSDQASAGPRVDFV